MRRILVLIGLLAGLWGGLCLGAQAVPPPVPVHWVTDGSNLLSPAMREGLDQRLKAYQEGTGHQVLVWIGGTTGGDPLEDWTVRAFAAWTMAWWSSFSPGTRRSASKWVMGWRGRFPTSWPRRSSGRRSCRASRLET